MWKLVRIIWFSGLSYECEIDDIAPVNQADLQCRLYNSTQYNNECKFGPIKNALAYSLLTSRLMLTPKILGIFSLFPFFFLAFCFFLSSRKSLKVHVLVGWDEEGVIKLACFIIDFKVKNLYISKETNNKLNSRNAVTMINSVVDQKKNTRRKLLSNKQRRCFYVEMQ